MVRKSVQRFSGKTMREKQKATVWPAFSALFLHRSAA